MKTPHIKYSRSGGRSPRGSESTAADENRTSCDLGSTEDEQFAAKKQQWQEELEGMSDFLVLKSTEEQRAEGVEQPVDTAYVEDKDGMPILKAVFDVSHFKPDDIQYNIENDQLTIEGTDIDDRPDAVFRKTMIRKMDLPKNVDSKLVQYSLSTDGKILTVTMPFHLPPQRRPTGPNVVPITEHPDGTRRIRLAFMIGPEFTNDDITLETNGRKLLIKAAYNEDVGQYGKQVSGRDLRREYHLPDYVDPDIVNHVLSPDGRLFVEIILKKEKRYKCEVTTEDLDITAQES